MTEAQKQRIELYKSIIAKVDTIELKGKTMPYTSANGHMFSLLNKEGEIGFRFSKEQGNRFLKKYPESSLFKSYGAFLEGYVVVPESIYNNTDLAAKYLNDSLEYVLSLEPK